MAMAEAPYERRPAPAVGPDGVSGDAPGGTSEDPAGLESERAPALSWAEQEVLTALKRLARAQSQLQALEAQVAPARRTFDPVDAGRLDALAVELVQARSKASGRFAKGAARDRVSELEMSERLLLERLGVSSYAEYRAVVDAPAPTTEPVDDAVLSFARQELASAQQAWLDVQAFDMPADPEPPAQADPADEADHVGPADRPTPDVA